MPVFWGNRNRHKHHHDHHTNVTMTGTRVIGTDGHRARPIVPTANVSAVSRSHVVTAHDHGRYHHTEREPSALHGFMIKILGALTGNKRRRRRGEREMRKAREYRQARRTARAVERDRATGHLNKLSKFRRRRRHRSRDRHNDPVVIAQDGRSRRTPWLHHSRRTLPPYHGVQHRILGFFTGGRNRRAQGMAMGVAAEEERRRERRYRRDDMRDQGRQYRERRRRYR